MGYKCKACNCGWNYTDSATCCFCGKGMKNRIPDGNEPLLVANSVGNSVIVEWQKFYKDVFGFDVDFSNVKVPAY